MALSAQNQLRISQDQLNAPGGQAGWPASLNADVGQPVGEGVRPKLPSAWLPARTRRASERLGYSQPLLGDLAE